MHLLGWVSIHDTHHHMGVLRKKFVVGIFSVWIFGLLHPSCNKSSPPLRSCCCHGRVVAIWEAKG
jgi:hypothetical protein